MHDEQTGCLPDIATSDGNTKCHWLAMISLDLLQWPAMAVTVLSAWLVASKSEKKRGWGFWLFLFSNALWIAWGLPAQAYALVTLQICLAFMNIRGARKNRID